MAEINYSIDYYGVLGISETADASTIKKQSIKLQKALEKRVRVELPDTIRKEVREEFKRINGREPSGGVDESWINQTSQERIAPFSNPALKDKRLKEAEINLRFISDARKVMTDAGDKRDYDRKFLVRKAVNCYSHTARFIGENARLAAKEWTNKNDAKKCSNCYFCTQNCLDGWLREEEGQILGKKSPSGSPKPGSSGASSKPKPTSSHSGGTPRPHTTSGGTTGKKCSQCGSGSPRGGTWVKFNTTASILGGDEFCSENCLFNNLSHKYPGRTFPRCVDCSRVTRKRDWTDVISHVVDELGSKEIRCKNTCYDSWLRNKRNWFIKNVLENIKGWKNILTEPERTDFRNRISLITFGKFKSIRHEVESLIDSRSTPPPPGPGSPHTDPLAAKKNLVIREIKRNLDEDPVVAVEELDSENQDWEEKIQNASDGNIIEQIKTRVLDDIKNKRNKKNLEQIRSEIINKINNYLSEEPKVKNSELSDISNWESLINQATSLEVIEKIRDSVLANIVNIKKEKGSENDLNQLIAQAREAIKAGDWAKLDELLEKINLFQNTAAYFNKQEEIKTLGKKLIDSSADGLSKYQDNTIDSFNEILSQDPPVDIRELSENNQNYIEAIKNAKNQDEVDQIKDGLFDNVNEVRTEKKVDDLLVRAQKVDENDNEEISRLRQEIVRLMKSDNKYEKVSWEKNKHKFEKLPWFSSGETSLQDDKNPNNFLLIGLTVAALVAAVVVGLLIIRKKRLSRGR